MNTGEQLVAFLPALFIATSYRPQAPVCIAGIIYLTARFLYWRSYVDDPATRNPGFALTLLPILALVVAGLAGIASDILP